MPERQSSTDEETQRPVTENTGVNGAGPTATDGADPARNGNGVQPEPEPDGSGDGATASTAAPTPGEPAAQPPSDDQPAALPDADTTAPAAGSAPDAEGEARSTGPAPSDGPAPSNAAAPNAAAPVDDAAPVKPAVDATTSLFHPTTEPAPGSGLRPTPRNPGAETTAAVPAPPDPARAGGPTEPVRPAGPPHPTSAAGAVAANGAESPTVRAQLPGAEAASAEGPTRPTALPDPARPDVPRPDVPRPDVPSPGRTVGGDAPTQAVALPSADAETTQVIPLSQAAPRPFPAAAPGAEPPTQQLPMVGAGRPPVPPGVPHTPDDERPRRRRPLLIGAAVVAVLALLYVGDLVVTSGSVPRGTTVAGVDVGGLSLADAERDLRAAVEPRSTQPVPVTAGTVTSEIDPTAAGLTVDWAGTLAQAGDQPLNPFTRVASFFTTGNVLGVVTTADDQALRTAIEQLAPVVDTEPAEGTVRFEGTTPVPVDPVPGQRLDAPVAVEVVKSEWASGVPIALPLISLPARTTVDDVATAVRDVAAPAVSGPVTVIGEMDTRGTLEPEVIAEALSFEPGEDGGLTPVLNPTVVTDALEDQLAASEQEARDAEIDFATTPPTIVPSQDGRGVDYDATLADLLSVLTGSGPREITAVYADQPADLTTDELNGLGDAGEISSFTTGGFAQDSGVNIRRAAELVNGTIVGPGETFSLDAVTGPRTAANGYVEAGVIDNGRAGRGIAGGVSQVSTTTYNAAYFAGMTDIEHRPHSFYISRYPEGREATIVTGALDMRFRNDTPTAVLIRTVWTPSNITVTFYGTKYYEVSSATSGRSNFTEPNEVTVPAGEPCTPSQGSQGFTVTDTRTLRNLQTGEVTTEPQTTRYNPAPRVICGD